MPFDIDLSEMAVLQRFPREPQGPVGLMPVSWADLVLDRWRDFDPPLPTIRHDRTQLRAYCRDAATPAMHAFIAIMAWGGQMPQKLRDYRREVVEKRSRIEDLIGRTRDGATREAGYEMWRGRIRHLGPSFVTKLLAFLSPGEDMAIMDQWAVKSVNLLYGREVIRLAPPLKDSRATSPAVSNRGTDYERYCLYLDDLRSRLGEPTLSAIEERIFSRPGADTWRQHVVDTWTPAAPSGRRRGCLRGVG